MRAVRSRRSLPGGRRRRRPGDVSCPFDPAAEGCCRPRRVHLMPVTLRELARRRVAGHCSRALGAEGKHPEADFRRLGGPERERQIVQVSSPASGFPLTFGPRTPPLEAAEKAYSSEDVRLGWWIRARWAIVPDTSSETSLTSMRSPAALAPSSSMM